MDSRLGHATVGEPDDTAGEDLGSISEILKLVPEVFLRDHLAER